jgi:hypothetical protein
MVVRVSADTAVEIIFVGTCGGSEKCTARRTGLRLRHLFDRQDGSNQSSRYIRLDLESAAELPQPLSHTAHSDTGTARHCQLPLLFLRDTFTTVLDFKNEVLAILMDAYRSRRASGMPMNVGQTFLNDSEDGHFHAVWKSP